MSTLVKVWLTLLLTALTAYGGYTAYRFSKIDGESLTQPGHVREKGPNPPVGKAQPVTWADVSKVTLTERNGAPLSLGQYQGKVWIVNFFFASCPGSCKVISSNLAGLQKDFAKKDVTLVSISVDPEADTPAALTTYANSFGADPLKWRFLTGDFEVIRALCSDIFKMPVERKTHADRLVLIDRDGQIAGTYNSNYPEHMAAMKRKVDVLLDAKPGEKGSEEKSATPAPDSATGETTKSEAAKS